ncbi:MAG: HPF/RaiA family ribosome-associated protein [Humibacillus sp.]|nr:HPF/RaiA family ribosome-associated protein [Humibacillus sp.]MDN5779371.1 HPF/RaiA family ribosome-associated protein [Humibacillus sp.]
MHVEIHTDNTINGSDALTASVTDEVRESLEHHDGRVQRIEVHLADESAGRATEDDIRCLLTADLKGQSQVVASHHANSVEQAVTGAAHKLARAIEHRLGRISGQTARDHA